MSARVFGLTGQTGAGKTTVCQALADEGFSIINCDALTREVQSPHSPCVQALAAAFGREVVLQDGALDRKAVAARAFADEASLEKLNRTVYPYIMAELKNRIKQLSCGNTKGIVLDAPTLLESGADALCEAVIAVLAPESKRLARIMARDAIDEPAARARMAAQRDDAFYTARAQYVLVNDGTPETLAERTQGVAQVLLQQTKGEVLP